MAQLWKVRLPNGQTLIPGDWTSAEPLYSTVEIGPGSFPVLTAFSGGIGAEVPGSVGGRQATIGDTNLQGEGARLPEDEELIAYSISVEAFMIGADAGTDPIPAPDAPDISLLNMLRAQRDLVVVTRIAYIKEYTRAPMSWFPAGTGTHQYNSGARTVVSGGTQGTVVGNNGGNSVSDARHMASPLYVAGGESLAVDFIPGPGSIQGLSLEDESRLRLRLYFEGYRKRPVA
jgi:hypothetical protein